MAIELTYQQLLHDTALRLNALVGTTVDTIEATYDNVALNDTHFKSADWPINSFRDTLIMAVADFAWAIADTGSHPWRAFLAGVTAPLANGVTLPSTSATNREIIGIWGAVRDSADNMPLTEQPLEVIRRVNQSASWRTYPLYFFKIDGGSIEHTRPFAEVECCTFSTNDQYTAWSGIGTVPLPAVLRLGIVSRAIALLTKDGAWESQARIYADYADAALMRIRNGLATVPAKTLPNPTVEVA